MLPVHAPEEADAVREIPHDDLVRALGAGTIVLLDVLPDESYVEGHIPGARSLPLVELPRRAAEVVPDRKARVATYCGGFT
ncbi:MAG: rhodanese-like domain-containing protein [Thermoanaerobaculia bacterium]